MTQCFHGLLKDLGYQIDVFYFVQFWHWLRKEENEFGDIKYRKIPYVPVIFFSQINYLIPSLFLNKLLKKYDLLLSVSGSFHVSLPFAINRKKHISKVATPYYEEHQAKFGPKIRFDLRHVALAIELYVFRPVGELIERFLYRSKYNKAVLMDSEYTKRILAVRHGEREGVYVFPYCVDPDIFKPALTPSVADEPYVFACGRFNDERKNLDLLLRAFSLFRKLGAKSTQTKLMIAGFKPSDERAYAQRYGLGDSVVFLGFVTEAEKVRYYQEASLFVLPSKQEGLGIVVLEAMACGVPVLSTKCGGPESIIEDGINGIFTDMDEQKMAAAMLRVISDPALAQELRKNGLNRVRECFSKEAASKVLKEAIGRLG